MPLASSGRAGRAGPVASDAALILAPCGGQPIPGRAYAPGPSLPPRASCPTRNLHPLHSQLPHRAAPRIDAAPPAETLFPFLPSPARSGATTAESSSSRGRTWPRDRGARRCCRPESPLPAKRGSLPVASPSLLPQDPVPPSFHLNPSHPSIPSLPYSLGSSLSLAPHLPSLPSTPLRPCPLSDSTRIATRRTCRRPHPISHPTAHPRRFGC